MRARADRRARQRNSRPPLPSCTIDNDCNPEVMPQYFQISVNVLEARKLVWSNSQSMNSYVVIVLGKKKHRSTVRRNMEEPFYRESFIFDMYVSLRDIQSSNLWLAIMEPRCCAPPRLMGETTVDLGAIWAQPHHQVYHKWAQLSLPRDLGAGPVGFVKVDISIIFRGEVQVMPAIVSNQKLEDNLLLPSTSEQQRANYLVTIYGAFGIPCSTQVHNEKRKLPSTYARVSFCGLVAKTAVQQRTTNPMFCEQVSIVEMFPNLNQTIKIEICSLENCFHKILASTVLNLEQISHGGENGFLPTFGPSLIHMYGSPSGAVNSVEDGPFHRGSLLVALKTIVPYYQQGVRSISIEPATPIQLDSLWLQEDFCIICPVVEVSMLDRRVVGKMCGVAITIGDIPSERGPEEDFAEMVSELRTRKFHYTGPISVIKTRPANYGYLDFPNAFPVLQLATHLPDFRFRMYRNNMIYGIVADLELTLNDVERRLKNVDYTTQSDLVDELNKAIDDAAGNILKFLDIVQYSHGNGEETTQIHNTELDQKQLALQKEEIEKIYQQISRRAKGSTLSLIQAVTTYATISQIKSKKSVKLLLAETKTLANSLRDIIYKTSEGWPDIVVWLLSGGSRVAYTKISTADVIYSVIPEQCGRNCGRIQTIYLKPLKCQKHVNNAASACFCIAGKIEILIWMGLYRQRSVFDSFLPQGYNLKVRDYDMCVTTNAMVSWGLENLTP